MENNDKLKQALITALVGLGMLNYSASVRYVSTLSNDEQKSILEVLESKTISKPIYVAAPTNGSGHLQQKNNPAEINEEKDA